MVQDIYTEQELCAISGHYTREGLSTWLNQQGIPFIVARSGWPRVHVKALEAAMGVKHADAEVASNKAVQFNFDALR